VIPSTSREQARPLRLDATLMYADNSIGIVSDAMQLNVLVPDGHAGDEPIVVTVGTAQSQSGATVSVR
jgi:uncharacterized protein (TIGR03437 family)